jgi:hypothetical protein
MENVKTLIKDIKENLSQASSSSKDEIKVMRSMLNDKEFVVDIYDKEGKSGTYCPAESVRGTIGNIIASTTKITRSEAESMVNDYEFKNSDAETFVNLSKEYINTYLDTGRKLPLGTRETSDICIVAKDEPEKYVSFPKKVGTDENGNDIYGKDKVLVPAHKGIKAYSPCPEYLKK